jgi:DNA/RNA-binding domain of Phe-tRNA-synthetase-like protein
LTWGAIDINVNAPGLIEYRIDPAIFRLCPGYRRGLLLARELRNGASPPALVAALRTQEAALRDEFKGNPAEHPRIAAWREAYRRFGARPSDFRASVEALARRVLRGDALPGINALVDIGNVVSLRHLLPVGAHPIPAGGEPLCLRLAAPTDRFAPPDGGKEETPESGEVVFAQGMTVLTRRWTWRQSAGTLTRPETQAVFFNLDALEVVPDAALAAAARDLQQLVHEYCGGRSEGAVLSEQTPAQDFG